MSIRTYCVIPHGAREDTDFFQGVFEDGVRVRHQGRLQSLLFSHVLSPAHDYVKHINGPLLAMLREGGNATLIVATPTLDAPTTPAASTSHEANLSEVTATAMELYTQLFPLLFRNLDQCDSARVCAVTVSAEERVLLDSLADNTHLHDLSEAQHLHIRRHSSATEWGVLLQTLQRRHAVLAESTTSVEGQTACAVVVELHKYGRLVVVDTASSQQLLQQLTLILAMDMDGDARTYPSHTPLRDLLVANVPPQAAVQVVCLPAPQCTRRQTMRVLHFGSTVEAWRSDTGSAGAGTQHSVNRTGSSSSLSHRADARTGAEGSLPRARAKVFARPTHSTSSPPNATHRALSSRSTSEGTASDDGEEEKKGASPTTSTRRVASSMHTPRSRNDNASALHSGPQRYTGQHVGQESASFTSRSDTTHDFTPAQLPPPSASAAESARHRASEEKLRRRVATLEAHVAAVEADAQRAKVAYEGVVRDKARLEAELRTKAKGLADLQRTHEKAKQENADYAQLTQKLLLQIRTLEKDTSRQKRQDITVVKELREVREEKAELAAQLARLRKEVMLFRRDATYRAREATLSRIVPSDISVPPLGAPSAGAVAARSRSQPQEPPQRSLPPSTTSSILVSRKGRGGVRGGRAGSGAGPALSSSVGNSHCGSRLTSPRARRLYDSSTEDEAEKLPHHDPTAPQTVVSPSAQPSSHSSSVVAGAQRVTDITVEELRWRNRHLEQEVARLQERLLTTLTAENTSPQSVAASASVACPRCAVLQERVDYFQAELSHVRQEKDRLLSVLQSSRTRQDRRDGADGREEVDSDSSETTTELAGRGRRGEEERGSGRRRHAAKDFADDTVSAKASARNTVHGVADALLTGCASLQAQLACAEDLMEHRLTNVPAATFTTTTASASARTDPLSRLSAPVIAEHREAVAALAESLRHIADKPATAPGLSSTTSASFSSLHGSRSRDSSVVASQSSQRLLPPVPRTATAGNVETLSCYLSFEAERCRHLRAFVPTFAQLAVATEHLLMRLEATEPGDDAPSQRPSKGI